MSRRFETGGEGIQMTLEPAEASFLSDLLSVLGELGDPATDPGAARLSPPVYLDDPEADAEWRRLAGSELEAARRADRSAFELVVEAASEGPVEMSPGEAAAFIRVVNEARLVLGARWGIRREEDFDDLRPEAEHAIGYLGWMVAELASLLSERTDAG